MFLKDALSLMVSSILLVLASPIILLAALAIRLESKGPLIFRQERVGQNGRTFELLKFRSMAVDAEAKTGPVWAAQGDKRVTRVGRILRKTRIDELPQLFNVLRGDMHFVGPRPERPVFVKELQEKIPYYGLRHIVKPGITGWAQINYGYGRSQEDTVEKLQYDLFYIKNLSVLLDCLIILETAKAVIKGRGV
jgi:exopolysaccharide biosynthesis polyprenyl glycosylphosphotransferase